MAKAKPDEKEEQVVLTAQDIVNAQLKANKGDHYNDLDETAEIKVSTGSLLLDSAMSGGVGSGLVRLIGFTESGKSSCALQIAKNFLATVPKSRAMIVKAEGRLSREMRDRTGLKFVWKSEEWTEGTCLVLETNVYDLVIGIMRDLIVKNETDNRYCFILDSMDGLILKSDMDKDVTENGKVAGAPALTKKFLQRLAIAMNKFGHLCIMIGQVSAKIEINDGPKEARQVSATGGNAALHFSNWILDFQPRWKNDLIVDDPKAMPDMTKNRIKGHWCKLIIKKSTNETSNTVIQYPIKYGRSGGNSIWIEKEITDMLLALGLLEKKGSWLKLSDPIVKELTEAKIEIDEKYQGSDNFSKYLESNPAATKHLFALVCKLISVK